MLSGQAPRPGLHGARRSHGGPQLPADDLRVATAVGVSAGAVNGMLINVLAGVKYQIWNTPRQGQTFPTMAAEMWQQGGMRAFMKGMYATGLRDTVFGTTYEVLRTALRKRYAPDPNGRHGAASGSEAAPRPMRMRLFGCDVVAALVATIASGPLNYARNMQFAR